MRDELLTGGVTARVDRMELLKLHGELERLRAMEQRARNLLCRLQAEPEDPGRVMDVVKEILIG